MEKTAKTHWKKLVNPEYLGAYSLNEGQELTLTIKSVAREQIVGTGGKKEECTVARFVEPQKPMILNVTNCKSVAKVAGSSYIEDWTGKRVTIYATTTKLKGELVECLRIRDVAPSLPELTPKHEKYADAVKALKAKSITIEGIRQRFDVSPETEAQLNKDAAK